ncbi:hypothetical protein [Aureimonas frigidaquae]|uniref:hypothetical protein n=1 Tax=Aureimonas frigidaquae TaxID=424757 RepID=UPI000A64DEE0|nr:hypothetical protein [Aureimonas frigidaquae]
MMRHYDAEAAARERYPRFNNRKMYSGCGPCTSLAGNRAPHAHPNDCGDTTTRSDAYSSAIISVHYSHSVGLAALRLAAVSCGHFNTFISYLIHYIFNIENRMSAISPGPIKDAAHLNASVGTTDFAAAVRSSVLELVSSARMLGKAEMLCELDSDADPSVKAEFELRVKQARASLELLMTGEGDSLPPTIQADLPAPSLPAASSNATVAPSPAVARAAPAETVKPSAAAAVAQSLPKPGVAPGAAAAGFSDWDEESRVGLGPIILVALAALGLLGWYLLHGAPGTSGAFQYYQQRERCLAVSDALLDMRNGRTPRLNDSREQLQREATICDANGIDTAPRR